MQTNRYQGLKISDVNFDEIQDHIVVEAPLQININGEAYTVMMRTPGDDFQLIRGLLYAEDIYKKSVHPTFTVIKSEEGIPSIIDVTIPADDLGKGYVNKRSLLSVSSCGICGTTELENLTVEGSALSKNQHFDSDVIHQMMVDMRKQQSGFELTGGSHAAALFDGNYQLLTAKEDIGRHNAVDKVIGEVLAQHQLEAAQFLTVSGRVSYEIITKAFVAKIPVVIAVSACSSMAIDYAKEFGICLIGFTRTNKLTAYTHINRLEKLINV